MPHQNVDAGKATAQNAATDPVQPSDRPQGDAGGRAPDAYAAADWKDASVAGPAAGELADAMDEGEPLDAEAQQGRDRTNIAARSRDDDQGPKTTAAQARQRDGGDAG